MKKLFVLSLFLLPAGFLAMSQTQPRRESVTTTEEKIMINELTSFHMQYLLDEFQEGTIYLSKKGPVKGTLNYNILLNEVQYYDQNGELLSVPAEEAIDSVVMGGHLLMPVMHTLLEVFHTENGPLLLHHTISYKAEKVTKGAYGSVLRSSTVDQVVNPLGQPTLRDAFRVMNPTRDEMELVINYEPKFYLNKGNNQLVELDSRRNVSRAFPEHSSQVNSFIRKNKIDFDSAESMKKLASFLHSLL